MLRNYRSISQVKKCISLHRFVSSKESDQGYLKVEFSDKTKNQATALTQGFNQRWRSVNCKTIYQVQTDDGVVNAMNDALTYANPGEIRVRCGGHCYEDFVDSPNTKVIIDVNALKESGENSNGYYLGSGFTNLTMFDKIFREQGLVIPGGSCYSVGLGGIVPGGGYGIMARLHGTIIDYLSAIDIVVVDKNNQAKKLTVGRHIGTPDERKLFWAHTGGGGGNFGVITKFYFKDLPKAPIGALLTTIRFQYFDKNGNPQLTEAQLKKLLDWYVDFATLSKWNHSAKFYLWHKAVGHIELFLHSAYHDSAEQAQVRIEQQSIVNQLNAIIPIPTDMTTGLKEYSNGTWTGRSLLTASNGNTKETGDFTFYESTQWMNGSGLNRRGKYKSAYYKEHFPEHQISTVWKYLNKDVLLNDSSTPADMTASIIQVDAFGGKIRSHPPETTALASREFVVKTQYQTYWLNPNDDSVYLGWIRDFYDEMFRQYGGAPFPDRVFEGCYYNYPDVDLNHIDQKDTKEKALELYFLGNLKRLVEVKSLWDPLNVFQHDQSIPLRLSYYDPLKHGPNDWTKCDIGSNY